MTAASMVIDVYTKAITWLASDDGPRSRARRASWPALSRLDAWPAVRGALAEVDFIRCAAIEPCMWTVLVVPGSEE